MWPRPVPAQMPDDIPARHPPLAPQPRTAAPAPTPQPPAMAGIPAATPAAALGLQARKMTDRLPPDIATTNGID